MVHDAQFRSSKESHKLKSWLLYNFITPMVAKRYKSVVTISEYARAEIVNFDVCDRNDIKIINNGV